MLICTPCHVTPLFPTDGDTGILKHPATSRIIPTNSKLSTLEVDGQMLFNMLEKNLEQVFSADPFQQKGENILCSSGLFMTFKPYNPKGHRIQTLQVGGKVINLSKTYKIAGGGQQLFKEMEEKKTYHEHQAIGSSILSLKTTVHTNQIGRTELSLYKTNWLSGLY